MKIKNVIVGVAVAGALVLASLPASARSATATYVGTSDPLTFGQCADSRVPVNVGEVCFNTTSADHTVRISSADAVLGEAGLFYIMADATGNCVGQPADPTATCPNDGFICGHSSLIAVPAGTVQLQVYPLGMLGATECTVLESSDVVGAATTGTITALFA